MGEEETPVAIDRILMSRQQIIDMLKKNSARRTEIVRGHAIKENKTMEMAKAIWLATGEVVGILIEGDSFFIFQKMLPKCLLDPGLDFNTGPHKLSDPRFVINRSGGGKP